jgi:alkylated DNA repair dioxygenase AlkB
VYSGIVNEPLPWTPALLAIKSHIEAATGSTYNSCLLNLYRSGDDAVSWHADDEAAFGPSPTIASLSLGAARRFEMKRRDGSAKVSVLLEPGSLLVMSGRTQEEWLHRVPRDASARERINLTFRKIVAP